MKISGKQITAARNLLGINQTELAEASEVAPVTIARFEAGLAEPHAKNIEKIARELERRGIEFTNGDGIGVRLNFAKAEAFARVQSRAEE